MWNCARALAAGVAGRGCVACLSGALLAIVPAILSAAPGVSTTAQGGSG
jgi:hypothetical protein